jgi:hypothetical protein
MAESSTHEGRLAPKTQKLRKPCSMWMRQDSWESGWKLSWLLLFSSRPWWLYRVCSSPFSCPVSVHTLFSTWKTAWSMPHGRRHRDQNREHTTLWSAVAGLPNPNTVLAMSSGKHQESATRNCTTIPKQCYSQNLWSQFPWVHLVVLEHKENLGRRAILARNHRSQLDSSKLPQKTYPSFHDLVVITTTSLRLF